MGKNQDHFHLMLVDMLKKTFWFAYSDPLTMSTQVSDDVLSSPFTVYSAKNFPGMTGMKKKRGTNRDLVLIFFMKFT